MVRLVFRPYTQVGRPICTSGPLRASTRVSSGFALPRHSSPSFGSYRPRSCSTSPTERARRAGGAPGAPGGRDPTSAGARRPSLSLRPGVSADPLTRAGVRLLGPCFKTGRVGCRHRRRPLTPLVRGPIPALATRRGWGALRTVRPGRQSRRERGAPSLPAVGQRGRSEHSSHGPGKRRGPGGGRCKARRRSGVPPSPRAFPGRPRAGRGAPPRRKCARRGPAAPGERSLEGILPHRAAVPGSPS